MRNILTYENKYVKNKIHFEIEKQNELELLMNFLCNY
jgi:hypothetical protein